MSDSSLDSSLEIVFRGDIVSGHTMVEVRDNLRELFKADDAQLAKLFSGRPVVIRRNLDEESAKRYQQAMERAGAVVQVRQGDGGAKAAVQAGVQPAEDDISDEPWTLFPVGADLLRPEERIKQPAVNLDVANISVAPAGSDVLAANERREQPPVDVDTSHIDLEPAPTSE
ncbi:hypothetical protein QSV34_10465 [Porticoccus sp. W117]|uniref:hypothetical protein n=1 Tax=Porticoccus sp. W117 TaxID=3054777 RepID=UPI0025996F12|nr:hypothetical protein [Porticoccus sp. W117]MDM3871773.1 hypothetical protein [Porticoccus sp. W117]